MKKSNFLKAASLLLCLCASLAFGNINPKSKLSGNVPKAKAAKHKKKAYAYPVFFVLNFGGNEYEFFGQGGGSGGSIIQISKACINGVAYSTGTCSGTYSISGGILYISDLYFTVTGFPEQGPVSGGSTSWSSSYIDFDCGGGGGPQ